MRKILLIIMASIMLFVFSSCQNSADLQNSDSDIDPSQESPAENLESPAPPEVQQPSIVNTANNKERAETFKTFLSDNYKQISEAFVGGISGIGFIDLDMDGEIEMLIFDAGASAAMGVQFFDIIDGKVECVSANLDAVRSAFGGAYMSEVRVNANNFEDFRLLKKKSNNEQFFIVESGNGAVDFSYTELIRFKNENGILALESLIYKYEDYDVETGSVIGEKFQAGEKNISKEEYNKTYNKFFTDNEDLDYIAKGVFAWDTPAYEATHEGLLAMVDKAFSLYEKKTNS